MYILVKFDMAAMASNAFWLTEISKIYVSGFLWVLRFPPPIKLTTMI
jgi:hypothetical protein